MHSDRGDIDALRERILARPRGHETILPDRLDATVACSSSGICPCVGEWYCRT